MVLTAVLPMAVILITVVPIAVLNRGGQLILLSGAIVQEFALRGSNRLDGLREHRLRVDIVLLLGLEGRQHLLMGMGHGARAVWRRRVPPHG